MRSGNPALNANTFNQFHEMSSADSTQMTIRGTANKTMILLGLAIGTACLTWSQVAQGNIAGAMPWMIGGAISGFVLALIISFKADWAPVLAPLYALAEGLFLGGISAVINAQFPDTNIALQAVALTFGTMFTLLIAYQSGLIRATENFKLGVFAATGSIALVYLTSIVLGFFGMSVPLIHSSGPWGIAFSAFVVVIAAMNLVLDFDFIEQAAKNGAPKSAEWYGAFGLMVTLVWLYIEILRLLAKLNSRD